MRGGSASSVCCASRSSSSENSCSWMAAGSSSVSADGHTSSSEAIAGGGFRLSSVHTVPAGSEKVQNSARYLAGKLPFLWRTCCATWRRMACARSGATNDGDRFRPGPPPEMRASSDDRMSCR